ncbi:MAG TPA: hypothetical protein VEC11_07810 [Allosphingosinicella sp.]|nr:hypothetical protein [Allosphingosinicella sp.]
MSDFIVTARMVAEASGLVAGANQGKEALKALGGAAREAGQAGRGLGQASGEQAQQLRAAATAQVSLTRAQLEGLNALSGIAQQLRQAELAQRGFTQQELAAAAALGVFAQRARAATAANRELTVSVGQARAGATQLAANLGDVSLGLAMGVNPGMIFAQQIGQITQAVSLMQGGTSRFAAFMVSGWGIALTAGVTILSALVAGLFGASEATDTNATAQRQAISASDALSQAQGALGQMFDLTTGKVTRNTEAIRLNTIAIALNLRTQAQSQLLQSRGAIAFGNALPDIFNRMAQDSSLFGGLPGSIGGQSASANQEILRRFRIGSGPTADQRAAAMAALSDRQNEELRRAARETDRHLAAQHREAAAATQRLLEAVNNEVQGADALRIADETLRSVASGQLSSSLRRSGSSGRGRTRRPTDQTEFGEDAGDRIRDLVGQFSDTPPQVEAVRRGLADLDDLMSDIERRRPPNWQALLEQARAARPAIEAGLNRPFNEFIRSQDQSLQLMRLQAEGRDDEAEALQAILRLEQQMGPLKREQKIEILNNVRALQEQQRATEILRQRQQLYLNALGETRKALVATVEGALGGDLSNLANLPRQLLASFNRLTAESIIERLFGNSFRALEDEITGRNRVRDANEVYAATTERATAAVGQATDVLGNWTAGLIESLRQIQAASDGAAQNLANWNAGGGGGGGGGLGFGNGDIQGLLGGASGGDGSDVLVIGTTEITRNPRIFFQKMVEGLLQGILGDQLAGLLSKGISRGLEGAAIGSMVAGVTKALGIKTSTTGAQIGGALGNLIPGLPPGVGSAIGGLLGGLLGGALASTKRGSATITSVDGRATTRGNSSEFISQATSMAGSIQSGLQQIADQLGGQLGAFAVSIGVRDGKIRVDPTGRGVTKTKKGAVDFGDDEAAAVMFAIMDAIRDGAVTGLSAAVQKALQSSTDISKALREALKVDEVETLLKGPIGAMTKQLREFERQAAERVRIARQYGFDVIEIEKINAAERLKLEKQLLEERTGALQQLLDDLNFGDLFEGSITDQVARIREQLAAATAEAEAGIEGAADRQADLSRQLIDLLREGFGTAGPEFAGGLEQARTAAERVIQLENERLKAAQEAVAETNAQLNEANDQLAVQNTLLRGMSGGIDAISAGIDLLNINLGVSGMVPTGRSTPLN